MSNSGFKQPHHVGTLSPEMALLGLLFGKPGHGYDLHRTVIADLGEVWHLSQSQAYAILKRLEAQGDIAAKEIQQAKRPARQLLRMTAQGRRRFLKWLATPNGGSTRSIRMEFVTRLYFLQALMPDRVDSAITQQTGEAALHLERLRGARAALASKQVYSRMSLDLRIRQLEVVLGWLADCRTSLLLNPNPKQKET
ncbi:MAG TPA: helix-turn-helix transcriptional regulator [Thermoflexales bacterium]|nr:helix-turn-helix transcriptional regulator [Thermoflexales bacterium]